MTQINVLPWRAERKKIRNRLFYNILSLCVGITFLCVILVHSILQVWQRTEEVNILYLESEIKKINQELKEIVDLNSEKEQLMKSMQVIHALQHERFSLVRLLDRMVRVMPAGLLLTEFNRKVNNIQLQGIADTNASISELLRNLAQIEDFMNIRLTEVTCHKKQVGLRFKIEFDQHTEIK